MEISEGQSYGYDVVNWHGFHIPNTLKSSQQKGSGYEIRTRDCLSYPFKCYFIGRLGFSNKSLTPLTSSVHSVATIGDGCGHRIGFSTSQSHHADNTFQGEGIPLT